VGEEFTFHQLTAVVFDVYERSIYKKYKYF